MRSIVKLFIGTIAVGMMVPPLLLMASGIAWLVGSPFEFMDKDRVAACGLAIIMSLPLTPVVFAAYMDASEE